MTISHQIQVLYLIKRPPFFALSIYSLNFILLASSATNALSFGDDVIGRQGTDRSAGKDAAARGVAALAVSGACILHAFARRGGILLNNVFVVTKVAILCVFPVMALCVLSGIAKTNHASENLSPSKSFNNIHSSVDSIVQGVLGVLYAYQGYNQANYILCEIDRPRKTFVKGIIIAVGTVCSLYILVNLSYMIVVSKDQQLHTTDVALQFLVNVIGPQRAPRVLAAFTTISTLGNIIGQTFTAARVKQEIAKEGIIPYAKFFGENRVLFRKMRTKADSTGPEPTPTGALLLHWILAMFLILITWPTKPAYAYRILVNLCGYCTDVVPSFVMAVGLLALRCFTGWSSRSPVPSWLSITAASVFALVNGFPLVAVFIPPSRGADAAIHDIIPGFTWYMTALLSWSLLACGIIYWLCFRFLLPRFGARKGKEFVVEREPVFRMQNGERVQWHEIVLHSWVVKGDPDRVGQYVMHDI